jgi:hypothetical protein
MHLIVPSLAITSSASSSTESSPRRLARHGCDRWSAARRLCPRGIRLCNLSMLPSRETQNMCDLREAFDEREFMLDLAAIGLGLFLSLGELVGWGVVFECDLDSFSD